MRRHRNILHPRERVLAALPPQLRRILRKTRDRMQRLESQLRVQLPESWGGAPAAVDVVGRRLREADRALLEALRPFEQAPGAEVDALGPLEDETRFAYGVFVRQQLVAAGFCVDVSASNQPFAHACFAADYVHPKFRRRGLSHALHAGRLHELRRLECQRVFAWVAPENAAAHASLRTNGFVDAGVVETSALTAPSALHRLLACELPPARRHD
jgi:GNAT superfamily N-acetyltransferase